MAQLNTSRLGDAADRSWGLPGTRLSRRTRLWATASRVASRYAWVARPGGPSGATRDHALEAAHQAGARDLFEVAVALRGGFLKMGQFVSSRPDLLPEAYVTQLAKLQDRVPPAPTAAIEAIIEAEIGPIETHFSSFARESASAASLAQVHRAVRHDGRVVAVKVQYPRAAELVPGEMRDTRRMLGAVAKVVRGIGLDTIGEALESSITEELDYTVEAANIERFGANFDDEPGIVVPGVHRDLSTRRVLVMDWVEGENLARALRTATADVADAALRLLFDSYMRQILVDGFLHADPHPGNFLLQVTDDGPRLGIVDFGACSALGAGELEAVRDAYRAGATNDVEGVVDALGRLGLRTRSGDTRSLLAWATLFSTDPDFDSTRQSAWKRLVDAARTDPVTHIPPQLVMLGRVLIVQSGLLKDHPPTWDLDDLVRARLGIDDAPAASGPVTEPGWLSRLPRLGEVETGPTKQVAVHGHADAFDWTDATFVADPYPRWRELQDSEYLHVGPQAALVFTRHADVFAALHDDRLSANPRHIDAAARPSLDSMAPVFGDDTPSIMLFADPPDHTRLRRLVARAFTPRTVEALRPRVETMVDAMLAEAGHDFDVMATLAEPLPVQVICELLGVPTADHDDFKVWSSAIARMLDPIPDPRRLRKAVPAAAAMIGYFDDLLTHRRTNPGQDLLSDLVAVESEGDRLSHAELIALVILLFVAGHETTTNLIGNGVLALLRNPQQYAALVAAPDAAAGAVDEILRYDAPVQLTARTAIVDLELNGVAIAAGQPIMLGIAAANRDRRVHDNPDAFDLSRSKPAPLSFGQGIHYCLGATLAKMEGEVSLRALATRFPELSLADERPPYREHLVLRGLEALPVHTGK